MSSTAERQKLVRHQRKQHEWSTLSAVWEKRLSGELHDITPPEEFDSATTMKDGSKKFFLCDSRKVPVKTIEEGKFRLHNKRKNMQQSSLNSQSISSLSSKVGTNTELPKLSILKQHSSSELMKLSYVRPTLKGDSLGPGDAHKRALANYYHVRDSLPPEPLKMGEAPTSVILYYEQSAPPPLPVPEPDAPDTGLLCGATGKPIPYPHVIDYKSPSEKLSFLSRPLQALKKNTSERPKRMVTKGKRPSHFKIEQARQAKSSSILDYLSDVESSAASVSSDGTSAENRRQKRKTKKTMTSEEISQSMDEMSALLEDISVGTGEKWANAGIAIKKHFTLLKNGKQNGAKDLYKNDKISRSFERFIEEGPRRGDGCFEIDPKTAGVLVLEGLLQRSKQYNNLPRVQAVPIEKMKQNPRQRNRLNELKKELLKAQRRLMATEEWQRQHGQAERVKDKRNFDHLWESSSEEEEDIVEEERPKTREELWLGDSNVDLFERPATVKKEEKKPEFSERQIFIESMDLMEEIMMEYVYEFIGEDLEELDRLGTLACVVEVQARFRGWQWRNKNYKIVNRLTMRAKSRQKKRRAARDKEEGNNDTTGEAAQHAAPVEEYTDEAGHVWHTLLDEASQQYYYLNTNTGETQWA